MVPNRKLATKPDQGVITLDWLQLILSENVGCVTFKTLVSRYGDACAALAAIPELAAKGGGKRTPKIFPRAEAAKILEDCHKRGIGVVCSDEDSYPPYLRHIDDAPPVLFYRGHLHLALRPVVSIVGSRNASAAGRKFAQTLAEGLGGQGISVASGLARGVDTAAHLGSLATGTIAVVAGGVEYFYPPENQELQKTIGKTGLVLAENPPGTVPQARHFPRRNRIISGLAVVVALVEATAKSGSLITARMAAEQNREVFAVPGSPMDPRAAGTNRLLKDGAHLLESADDIIRFLQQQPGLAERRPPALHDVHTADIPAEMITRHREQVIGLLSTTPLALDELLRQSDAPPTVIQLILLELELAGRLERLPGNYLTRIY